MRLDRISRRQAGGVPDGALASLAKQLYRVLTDGAPRLRWNIRNGCQLRDATTKKPLLSSFTDQWRASRDLLPDGSQRDREANWLVLQQHLQGRYDVAIQAPSWSSLVVLDIDRPELGADAGDPLAELQADGRRDEVLAKVWRAYEFSAERQPVILRTPGGGYHVYLPHCRDEAKRPDQHPWPVAWARQRHEHHLDRARIGLKPGVLELYPTGVPLRAPCGRGMALLAPRNPDDPDDLQLELRHARWVDVVDGRSGARSTVLRRDVAPLVREFCERLEAARRPLESWLEPAPTRPAWGTRYGPFGDRPETPDGDPRAESYQHKVDVPRRAGAGRPRLSGSPSFSSPPARPPKGSRQEGHAGLAEDALPSPEGELRRGHLLHGRAFRLRIAQLTTYGLEGTGARHDAALKLAFYHHVCRRLGIDDTVAEVRSWLGAHQHVSATRARKEAAFVEDTLREVRHYLEVHLARGGPAGPERRGATSFGAPPLPHRQAALGPQDKAVLDAIREDLRLEARAVLAFVATYADEHGRVPHPVTLSAAALERLVGQRRVLENGKRRRASAVALEALETIGVLAVHRDYSVGRHGRQYTCWYRFGSGELPRREELGLVLGTRPVAEGAVVAVHGGLGEPPRVRFASLREGLVAALERPDAWWQRMYERRAFTPAEFFDAHERHVLPGPFRDRIPVTAAAANMSPLPDHGLPGATPASVQGGDVHPCPLPDASAARFEAGAPSLDDLRRVFGCRVGCTCRLCWEGVLVPEKQKPDVDELARALGCRPGCTCRLCWEGRLS